MKRIKIKSLLSIVLALLLSFSIVGCNNKTPEADVRLMTENSTYQLTEKGEPVEYVSHYFDITGGSDVMPIGGFHGPFVYGGSNNGNDFQNMMDEEIVAKLAECGINLIVYTGSRVEHYPDAYGELLETMEKYNMGMYLNSIDLNGLIGDRSPAPIGEINPDTLRDMILDMSYNFKYKSLVGFQLSDELFPTNQLKNAIKLANAIDDLGLPIDLYSNAHGWYGTGYDWFGLANVTYDEYVAEFSKLGVKVFSNTLYPYEEDTTGATDDISHDALAQNFVKLNHARKTSLEYDMAFWRMMQAGKQWEGLVESDPYGPTEGEWLFDANMSLLFGAKGLQFYTCIQYPGEGTLPDGTFDSQRNGLLGINGKRTQWWYYCQKLTTQVQAVDHILMNSASLGFIPHGAEANNLCAGIQGEDVLLSEFRQLEEIAGDSCFVGCFDYLGGSAYMVVNASRSNKASTTLSFDGNYGYDVTQRGQTVSVVGSTMELILQPGEAAMVVLR